MTEVSVEAHVCASADRKQRRVNIRYLKDDLLGRCGLLVNIEKTWVFTFHVDESGQRCQRDQDFVPNLVMRDVNKGVGAAVARDAKVLPALIVEPLFPILFRRVLKRRQ